MGYETRFIIKIDTYNEEDIINRLSDVSGYYAEDNQIYGKWYGHEEDLIKVSKEFPTALITVTGYGEDRGDIWQAYVLNGQYERVEAEIVFPKCTLIPLKTELHTVYVTIAGGGVDIPVEVEVLAGASEEEIYKLAKQQLKNLL